MDDEHKLTRIMGPLAEGELAAGEFFNYFWFMKRQSVIHTDPDILGGTPVFIGTRVPVQSLFDHLEAGDSIGDFLEGFPSVKRDQVIGVLEELRHKLLQPA